MRNTSRWLLHVRSSRTGASQATVFWSVIGVLVIAGLGIWSAQHGWLGNREAKTDPHATSAGAKSDPHAAGEHQHVHLSEQARKNLKLVTGRVRRQDFWRTIVVPGQVDHLPGHSERRINARVQGTVQKVHVVAGQTVRPGDPLVDLQVSSELLASAQANLLRITSDIKVNNAEIDRLKNSDAAGTIAGKLLLEKQYESRRLDAARHVQVQELMMRGLTNAQIETIVKTESLLKWFTVTVPSQGDPNEPARATERVEPTGGFAVIQQTAGTGDTAREQGYIIEKLSVFPGKLVQPGDELCDLAAHEILQVRGEAFETETAAIYRTLTEQWNVTAVFDLGESMPLEVPDLRVLYASSSIDPMNRTFEFFLTLPNEILRETTGPGNRTFRSWRYKPGQKVRLLVPVEKWEKRLVVPVEAVVSEGADSFVFRVDGEDFDRLPVVVEYRDSRQVVLARGEGLSPGDEIAMNCAYQLNLAMKRASEGGEHHHDHDH